ncbi:MAG: tetratricopeptide repeat protein [Aigarchaeota archaeon]|nr:tetratricopeptide repeat protein [Aigarchaeota archaeon]MDW8021444.1 tetratricopeptide repeat protein [Nitrososphaerota archaeon]
MDEEDSWRRANELERGGRLREAIEIYVKNAEKGDNLAFSAMNFLSAARCAVKLGVMDEAREFFRKAGDLYERLGESLEGGSHNYAEWAYLMASNCYRLSGDMEFSNRALEKAERLKKS